MVECAGFDSLFNLVAIAQFCIVLVRAVVCGNSASSMALACTPATLAVSLEYDRWHVLACANVCPYCVWPYAALLCSIQRIQIGFASSKTIAIKTGTAKPLS